MCPDLPGEPSGELPSHADRASPADSPRGVQPVGGPAEGADAAAALGALAILRAAARSEAELGLQDQGFVRIPGKDAWTGPLPLSADVRQVSAEVRLPATFPDALPEVFVDRHSLPRRIAHMEESGKVCLAPSGVLLDAGRPRELIREALARAAAEVTRGLARESDADLQTEFLAYWKATDDNYTYSICAPDGPLRTVVQGRVKGGGFLASEQVLLADSEAAAKAWATNLGADVRAAGTALFLPLVSAFAPPEFGQPLTVRDIRALVTKHADPASAESLKQYLARTPLPTTVLLSLPEAIPGSGRRLVAVRFERLTGDAAKAAAKGFRPGRIPPWRRLQFAGGAAVARLKLERLDGVYLAARGGASAFLAERTVVVVGVGGIGSVVARNLSALGVGRLRLVDPDSIDAENSHRHTLGVRHLRSNKAIALAKELRSLRPHQSVDARSKTVEEVLGTEADYVMSADAVVVAVGDETLERRLNQLLRAGPPRVHAWVEPLGIAAHGLLVLPGRQGCFDCLFATDPSLGLYNRAALTAPGQEIRRSLAGCAGTFSPFSALDSERAALEAADLAARMLAGVAAESELVTWRGERTDFEATGYALSPRASAIPPGARVRTPGAEFARAACEVCGNASRG